MKETQKKNGKNKPYYTRKKKSKRKGRNSKKSSKKNGGNKGGNSTVPFLPQIDLNIVAIPYDEADKANENPEEYSLDAEDLSKLNIGVDAWNESLSFYHHPAIEPPIFVFDRNKIVGFFIDINTWQTVLNLANSPTFINEKEYFMYFQSMSLHEIGHYIYCPYDLYTNGILLAEIIREKISENMAPVILNIFSDLIVDTNLYRRRPEVMEFELREDLKFANKANKSIKSTTTENSSENSKIFKLMIKCYEYLWNIDLNLPAKKYEDIEPIAKKISKIILKDFNDFTTWRKKVRKIAKLLKPLLNEEMQQWQQSSMSGSSFQQSGNNNNSDGDSSQNQGQDSNDSRGNNNSISDNLNLPGFLQLPQEIIDLIEEFRDKMKQSNKGGKKDGNTTNESKNSRGSGGKSNDQEQNIPLDLQILMGDPFEIKGADQNKGSDDENKSVAEELAQQMSLDEFIKVNNILKLVPKKEEMRIYYRGISKNLIKIKITTKKPGGSIPYTLNVWRLGDPLEKLDVFQSYMVLPKLIPNITTRKWMYKEGPGIEVSLELPDLMLVVDSSGSMSGIDFSSMLQLGNKRSNRNRSSPYHLALIASFAALQFAIKKGVKVAAVNFSDRSITQKWTKDYRKIEDVLLNYQGQGTTLPTNKILKLCREAERNSLIILITDFEIYNWEKAESDLEKILIMGNKFVGFFIGGQLKELTSKKFKKLIELGARFYVIRNIDDLIGLVIKEVEDTYI
ncbi:MAG: hypothetical protein ACTSRZ_08570 [Promethearchaeota archaeon]